MPLDISIIAPILSERGTSFPKVVRNPSNVCITQLFPSISTFKPQYSYTKAFFSIMIPKQFTTLGWLSLSKYFASNCNFFLFIAAASELFRYRMAKSSFISLCLALYTLANRPSPILALTLISSATNISAF